VTTTERLEELDLLEPMPGDPPSVVLECVPCGESWRQELDP
jgi:hypothetical protein